MKKEIEEVKRIIKSNTRRNSYTKNVIFTLANDELFRLNKLLNLIEDEIDNK